MPEIHKSRIPIERCGTDFLEFIDFDWSTKHRKFAALGVYVLDLIGTNYCKVGSTGAPVSRMKALESSTPYSVSMPFFVTGCGGLSHVQIEKTAHHLLSQHHVRGEWFSCDKSTAIAMVRFAVRAVADL